MIAGNLPGTRTVGARTSRIVVHIALILLAIFFLAPVVLMITTSLRPTDDIMSGALIGWPKEWTLAAWHKAWAEACIGTRCEGLRNHFWNSVIIVVPAVVISTALGAINGFALTKVRFRGADTIFTLVWLGCFIPYQAMLIPAAQVLGMLGLAGSVSGLILVYSVYGIPFTTLFFRNYYVGVPDELIRSATIDGADFWRTFIYIVLPLSPAIFVVSIIFQFTQIWNEFLFAVSFTFGTSQTETVALNNLVNTTFGAKEYNVDMAAAMISSAPTLLVYILAGRFFLRGLTAGSVKG